MEMVEQVEAVPEVVVEVEAALLGSLLLPAAPVESGPAAASAGTHSCESSWHQKLKSSCVF